MNLIEVIKQISSKILAFIKMVIFPKKWIMKIKEVMIARRKIAILGISVFGILLCLCIFFLSRSLISKATARTEPLNFGNISKSRIIPPEELFLPEEPDFIPGILPEREQRVIWTAEDAAPFWQDPLINGEEPWRRQIETVIDQLMERVP